MVIWLLPLLEVSYIIQDELAVVSDKAMHFCLFVLLLRFLFLGLLSFRTPLLGLTLLDRYDLKSSSTLGTLLKNGPP